MENTINQKEDAELKKFIVAQERDYTTALNEMSRGKKQTHWMWYIFPQIKGLGFSDTARYYAIRDLKQAADYLNHPLLGSRLIAISERLLTHTKLNVKDIFGSPDDLKLRSCMSLFAAVEHSPPVFQQVLDQFFEGKKDLQTQRILELKAFD